MGFKLPGILSEAAKTVSDAAKTVETKAKNEVAQVKKDSAGIVARAEVDVSHLKNDAFRPATTAAGAVKSALDFNHPTVTARDGFVAFDPNGKVVGGKQPGAVLKNDPIQLGGLGGFLGKPEAGQLTFSGPDGQRVATTGSDGAQTYALDQVSGVDPKKGGLMQVGVSTPGGKGDTAHVLALPKNYDGPVFVCDIDDTLRATSYADVAEGKNQPPIPGAQELLQKVAAQGVPIVYLSAGSDKMQGLNEQFLKQLPPGVLLDRQQMGLKDLNPLNQAEDQGNYKSAVLDQLKTTFPNVKLFGLGDDKYGDAQAYTRAGATTYIHDVKPDHSNLPADFHGTLTKTYTPDFINKVGADLQQAVKQSASFGGTPVKQDWMASLSSQLDQTTNSKVTQGNSFQLYVDGENTLPHILDGIDSAKRSICYETYNFLPGDKVAEQVADHLIAAKQRGVDVRVNVDAFGSREFPLHDNPTVKRLQAAGVQVQSYNPLDSIKDADPNRDHRKTVLIDGQTAFIGGMNTSEPWMGGPNTPGRWHDIFSKVQGPAVQNIANAFESSWEASGGKPFDVSSLKGGDPVPDKPGTVPMRVITHVPGKDENIRSAYLAMIDHAQTSINVENSFPLENDVRDALVAAAKRGVDVRYVVGSDQGLLGDANRNNFQQLLDAGVHIYVYPTRVHTKSISVDGQVATIGSSNLDGIALSHNREIIDMIQDPATVKSFDQQLFDKDVVGDSQGRKTLELPKQLHDSVWKKLADGVLGTVWPNSLQ